MNRTMNIWKKEGRKRGDKVKEGRRRKAWKEGGKWHNQTIRESCLSDSEREWFTDFVRRKYRRP